MTPWPGWVSTAVVAVEVAILLVAARPAARILGKPAFRRECRERPLAALSVATGLLVAGVGSLGHIAQSAVSRLTVIVAAASVALLAWFRARPAYGRRRGLPPGSLGMSHSLDAIGMPGFYRDAAARWGSVFKMSQFGRPVVCITDLSRGFAFLRANESRLVQSGWAFNRLLPGGYLEFMNGEQHRRYRSIFEPAFTGLAGTDCQQAIRQGIARHLRVVSRGAGGQAVPWTRVVDHAALLSVLQMVLGVAGDDPRVARFEALLSQLTDRPRHFLPVPQRFRTSAQEMSRAVQELVESLKVSRREDGTPPSVLSGLLAPSADSMPEPVIVSNLVFMVSDGGAMMRRLLGWLLTYVCEHPAAMEAIRAEGTGALQGATSRFVAETLRLHASEFVYRVTREACTLGAFRIPQGWLVRVCVREAHRQACHFPEPDRFDPSRFATTPAAGTYAPFGDGAHACFPAPAVLAAASGFVRELAESYTCRTAADAPAARVNRHWGFWEPGAGFRLYLTPREGLS